MALHSFQAALISVTYGRFLPSGCHANVEAQYEFFKYIWLEGKQNSVECVEQCVWERIRSFVWVRVKCACIYLIPASLLITLQHKSCLCDLLMHLWEIKWVCPRVQKQTVCVCGFIQCMYLYAAEVWCVSPPHVLKRHIIHNGFLQLPGNLCKMRQRNRGLAGKGCLDMKACRNGDNRLWIDEWRPVN